LSAVILAASIFRVKMEGARSSEALVSYVTTRHHNPEELGFNHRHEDIKSSNFDVYYRVLKAYFL
jgi:hypothetical protein